MFKQYLSLALSTFVAAGAMAQTSTINTDTSSISGDGTALGSWYGTSYVKAISNGVVVFYFKGNLSIPAAKSIRVVGSRPLRLIAGGDCTVGAGTSFDVSCTGRVGNAGGGDGGLGGVGNAGGAGGPAQADYKPSTLPQGGAGGTIRTCTIDNGRTGGDGDSGSSSATYTPNPRGADGSFGTSGNDGTFGFGNLARGSGQVSFAPYGQGGLSAIYAGSGFSGGSGGAGGYFSGSNGSGGRGGSDGNPGNNGFPGTNGADAKQFFNVRDTSLDLWGGSGGGGGASGSGGGAGGRGSPGGTGSGGGGGGAASCDKGGDGGDGGYGGRGGSGGKGGDGGDGGNGGGGAGAIEIGSLGKLIFAGTGLARGADASTPQAGAAGSTDEFARHTGGSGGAGKSGSADAGNGGKGGSGGDGGVGGTGGAGGNGGSGAGGTGGTIRLSAADLIIQSAVFNTLGGLQNGPSLPARSGSGFISFAFNVNTAKSYTKQPGDTEINSSGPQGANPFFNGAPLTPYIAGLTGGGAIAGVVADVAASQIINPATLPPNTVAALVRITSLPGNNLISTSKPAVALVNLGSLPLIVPAMGLGASELNVSLITYGWANDVRFGGTGPKNLGLLNPGQVYVTMIPTGTAPTLANMSGTYGNRARSVSTSAFGASAPLLLVLCPADLNFDGLVDDSDFSVFVVAYDTFDCADPSMPAGCISDLNGDKLVDDADFSIFVVAYDALLCP